MSAPVAWLRSMRVTGMRLSQPDEAARHQLRFLRIGVSVVENGTWCYGGSNKRIVLGAGDRCIISDDEDQAGGVAVVGGMRGQAEVCVRTSVRYPKIKDASQGQ